VLRARREGRAHAERARSVRRLKDRDVRSSCFFGAAVADAAVARHVEQQAAQESKTQRRDIEPNAGD
jgi:hypothetical protein